MESAPHKKQKPLYLILLMCSVLLLVIVVGLFLIKSSTTSNNRVSTTTSCTYDKNVCLFLKKLQDPDHFYNVPLTATITVSTMNKPTGQVVLATDTKNNVYVTSSESGKIQAELLVIDAVLYKKNAAGTWQQQDGVDNQALLQFRQKALKQASMQTKTTTYTQLGKENCGSLTCYQYQVSTPNLGNAKTYIFFDTNDYLLRKVVNQTQNGTMTETIFAYTPLSITPPTQ